MMLQSVSLPKYFTNNLTVQRALLQTTKKTLRS